MTTHHQKPLALGAAALLLAAVASSVGAATPAAETVADPGHQLTVPLSNPGRPAVLNVSLTDGSLTVKGYDGNAVLVVAREHGRQVSDEDERSAAGGLKRIPGTSLGVTAEEHDNTVSVGVDWTSRGVDLEISVPRQTSVHAATVNGGDLHVEGVSGEHELSNVNGAVVAAGIGGSAVVNNTNGDVKVSFSKVAAGEPMSFVTFNGDVEVTFPPGLAADWRIDSGRGEVLTDFDVDLEPQQPVVESGGSADRYRVRLARDTRAKVGGGGAEMRFKTVNGDIIIRRADSRSGAG